MAIEPEDLLPHFEREMARMRRSMRVFAEQYPKIAARLAITGEHSEDPHVERLLQSFALLAAYHGTRLEDDVPAFTRSLLETAHGAFLRQFPSCAIAQFDPPSAELTEPRTIPRGTECVAPASRVVFRTAYDVTLAPVAIASVRYTTAALAPARATLPPETTGPLSLTFELTGASATFAAVPDTVRLHLTGAREIVSALADAALLYTARTFVEADGSGTWKRVDPPLSAVGLADADALLDPPRDATLAPFHLLMEYAVFPERFDFLDLNFSALMRAVGSARRITLHLAIAGVHPDSHRAQRLGAASAEHARLFCTPVVNLFPGDAQPIETHPGVAYYAIRPLAAKTSVAPVEIWAVDTVRQTAPQTATLTPFDSLQHASAVGDLYWTVLRDEERRAPKPVAVDPETGQAIQPTEPATPAEEAEARRGVELALVSLNGMPADPGTRQLAITLACTHGDLSTLRERGSSLREGDANSSVTLLSRPSISRWPKFRQGELWELLSLLVPQPVRLNAGGLETLRRLCVRLAAPSLDAGRQFDALVSLSTTRVRRWMPGKPASAFVPGLDITLVVDEQRFAGFSLEVLARVMEQVFAPYAPVNSFVSLVLASAHTGATLRRGEPLPGVTPVV
ncbi:type VI secretion system baseplate subunit TssF [Burkholderia contaminans]|uniref:type VI secretion system baseplate subunit TssF n=1 Tax=Burkholderia contaminans TaxID=488447 RepID=UPI001589FAC1|nr:type VI secretion system baseplate subunit TssF [Burkholderia contaminans]